MEALPSERPVLMALYFARTGAVATPSVHSWSRALYDGRELNHIARWLRANNFHVYANSHFGGICWTCHSTRSWHYLKDHTGYSLALDVGTYNDVNERPRIINEVIPRLRRVGIGWQYALYGHVPNHHDHIHIDVGTYGKDGSRRPYYGEFAASRKESVYTAFPLGETRAPRKVSCKLGSRGARVEVAQRALNTCLMKNYRINVDRSFGPATRQATIYVQAWFKMAQTGVFDAALARRILQYHGTQRRGSRGPAVGLVQMAVLPDVGSKHLDYSFGPTTERWVKAGQRWAGLNPDGFFGPASRTNLIK